MLSGGRIEYALDENTKLGLNDVGMYDIQTGSTEYDYTNNVITGDFWYTRLLGENQFKLNAEFGGSWFSYTYNPTDTNQSYSDMIVDLDVDYNLKNAGLNLGLGVRMVGASFMSPTAEFIEFSLPLSISSISTESSTFSSFSLSLSLLLIIIYIDS